MYHSCSKFSSCFLTSYFDIETHITCVEKRLFNFLYSLRNYLQILVSPIRITVHVRYMIKSKNYHGQFLLKKRKMDRNTISLSRKVHSPLDRRRQKITLLQESRVKQTLHLLLCSNTSQQTLNDIFLRYIYFSN